MNKGLVFAYDGSLAADWVAAYALHLARATTEKRLTLLSVTERRIDQALLDQKIKKILERASSNQIHGEHRQLPLLGTPGKSLLQEMASHPQCLLISGTRAKETGRGLLAGSVSAELLAQRTYPVLAIRVVQPGLLGHPTDVLWALSGNPQTEAGAIPLVQMLEANLSRLSLLRVMGVPVQKYRHLTHDTVHRLEAQGKSTLDASLHQLRQQLINPDISLERFVVVSNDWAKEILIRAGRLRTEFLLMGASERTLPEKFLYGNPLEEVLRDTPCDVGIFRGAHP